jgi:hypothetical protein
MYTSAGVRASGVLAVGKGIVASSSWSQKVIGKVVNTLSQLNGEYGKDKVSIGRVVKASQKHVIIENMGLKQN